MRYAALLVAGLLAAPWPAAAEHIHRAPAGEHLSAQRLLYAGDMQAAVRAWETGLHSNPNHPDMLLAIGAALHLADRHSAAVPYLRRAAERSPGDWTLALFLGTVLHAAGQQAQAREQFEEVIANAPNRGTAELARDKLDGRYQRHAAEARRQGGSAWASGALKWSAQLVHVPWAAHPGESTQHLHDNGSLLPMLAMVAAASHTLSPEPGVSGFASGDYLELHYALPIRVFSYARGRYVVAVGSPSTPHDAADAAARRALLELLDFGLDHARALRTDPRAGDTLPLKLRSVEQLRAGDRPGAMASLREAVRQAPDDPHARRLLALLLAQEGDPPQAASQLAVALQHWPTHPAANFLAGVLELNAGRAAEARDTLKKAIVSAPTMLHAYPSVAKASLALQLTGEAIEALEHLLEIAPHTPDVDTQLTLLRGK